MTMSGDIVPVRPTPTDEEQDISFQAAHKKLAALLSSGDVKNGRRSREKARSILPAVKQQAGLARRNNPALDEQLISFIVEAILGAAWYTRSAAHAAKRVWLYIALNSAFVILLPVLLWCLGNSTFYYAIIPQLSGVLTGIFAIQKTLSAWFAQQQRYAAWYKAGSDLKSVYYGFLDACAAVPDAEDASIIALLCDRTAKSREIIEAEKNDFYQRLALPSFDVLDMLTSTRSEASTYISSFTAAAPAQRVVALGTKTFTASITDPDNQSDQVGLVRPTSVEMLAGDPDEELGPIQIAANEGFDERHASLQFVSDQIVDPKAIFLRALEVAGEEADKHVSRASNQPRVAEYLALLGYPFANQNGVPTRYCAAGVTWAAAKAYCDEAGISYDPGSELEVFRRALPKLRPFFRPSAGCQVIQNAAKASGNWMPRTVMPCPGWLVLYHWKVPRDVDVSRLVPEHIGYVQARNGDLLQTIEFNTTYKDAVSNQSDGGAVARRRDRSIANVVGYVATYEPPATLIV